MLTIPCIRRGSGVKSDKIASRGGKDRLTPLALSSESLRGVLSPGLFWSHTAAQIATATDFSAVHPPRRGEASAYVGVDFPNYSLKMYSLEEKPLSQERKAM